MGCQAAGEPTSTPETRNNPSAPYSNAELLIYSLLQGGHRVNGDQTDHDDHHGHQPQHEQETQQETQSRSDGTLNNSTRAMLQGVIESALELLSEDDDAFPSSSEDAATSDDEGSLETSTGETQDDDGDPPLQ
jgi:hypothetical protein